MSKKQCEFCQSNVGEMHKCSIERGKFHCNGCCEKISLGLLAGGTYRAGGAAFV